MKNSYERFFNCLLAFDFLICGVLVDAKRRTNFDRQKTREKRQETNTGETKKTSDRIFLTQTQEKKKKKRQKRRDEKNTPL